MVEVIATDECLTWYDGLDEQADDAMTAAVDTLRVVGVGLRAPLSSAINGSRYALRELRTQAGGRPIAERIWEQYKREWGSK